MAGNCFDVTPFEKANADYAYAQLRCAAPEGSIDAHFPWTFLHDLLVRHCVNARASDTGLSVHMRRLYAALVCVAHMRYQPFCYGEALNHLCYITAGLGYARADGSPRKYRSPNQIDLAGCKRFGARKDAYSVDPCYLTALTQLDGGTSTHYRIAFKDIQKAAKCGVIVKPKPSEVQFMLKKLAAYLPSSIVRKNGEAKNAQPLMETYTSRSGKRFVEYVDADAWTMLLNTVRQLPERPACFSEQLEGVCVAYARLHRLRSQFATWAFAQPADFAETMGHYDTSVMQYFRTGVSLSVTPCPSFWHTHCEEVYSVRGRLPSLVSLEDQVFVW